MKPEHAKPEEHVGDRGGETVPAAPVRGGQLLSTISTHFVKLTREHYGRGPIRAKTYELDDVLVVVMRGMGLTPFEKTLLDQCLSGRVLAMRREFQDAMAERYTATIERLTGRKVLAFLSQAHLDPDLAVEVFFLDRPLDEFGAVEVTEPVTRVE
jgi:uncharacterized protein YbcI